jgi:hypothetical protein
MAAPDTLVLFSNIPVRIRLDGDDARILVRRIPCHNAE